MGGRAQREGGITAAALTCVRNCSSRLACGSGTRERSTRNAASNMSSGRKLARCFSAAMWRPLLPSSASTSAACAWYATAGVSGSAASETCSTMSTASCGAPEATSRRITCPRADHAAASLTSATQSTARADGERQHRKRSVL